MKKTLLAIFLLLSFKNVIKAQDQGETKWGFSTTLNQPIGSFAKDYYIGVGGMFSFNYGITNHIAAFAQTGFIYHIGKLHNLFSTYSDAAAPNVGLVPAIVGLRYHHSNDGIFFSLGGGYTLSTLRDIKPGFTAAAEIGYLFPWNGEAALQYQSIFSNSYNISTLGLKYTFYFN